MISFLRKHKTLIRSFCILILSCLVTEIFYPTYVWAVTVGPTSMEVHGFSGESSGHNVNMVTGSFSYSVPITSIPDYPMSISYTPGAGMDDEASAFGFGFNSFSGAITRSAQGIPDDINGATTKVVIENQLETDINVSGNMNGGEGELNFMVGRSSQTGIYLNASFSASMPINIKLQKIEGFSKILALLEHAISGNLHFGLNADSRRDRTSFSLTYVSNQLGSISMNGSNFFASKASYNYGIANVNISSIRNGYKDIGNMVSNYFSPEKTLPSATNPYYSVIASSPSINSNSYSVGISIPEIIPVPGTPILLGGSLSGDFAGDLNKKFTNYGTMYLQNYVRKDDNQLADFGLEGENSLNDLYLHSPSYLQKDNFSVNCMGLSGSMQLLRPSYGIVSRNSNYVTSSNISLIGSFSNYMGVDRWNASVKTTTKGGVDILDLLKNSAKKSIAIALFNEEEVGSMDKKFKGDAEFRMKGDMAGDYLLNESSSVNNYATPANYNWISDVGGGVKLRFIGVEDRIPSYRSEMSEKTIDHNQVTNNVSNKIIKFTVGDIIKSYQSGELNKNIQTSTANDAFKLNQTIYSHYVANTTPTTIDLNDINSATRFSIINDLIAKKQTQSNYFDNLIADIRVKNAEGSTYLFNLPVFNKSAKEQSIKGLNAKAPKNKNGEYTNAEYSFQSRDNSTIKEQNYYYPYAWLLTAVVGEDYIDFDNIPGPSDGDLGHWVKFNYIKTADDYRWRFPFAGLSLNPNQLDNNRDDFYSVTSGTKENYHLASVESSDYVCQYTYEKRFDGRDAAGFVNGTAVNTWLNVPINQTNTVLGGNYSYRVSKIDLYKKNSKNNYSKQEGTSVNNLKKVKSTVFTHDYMICPKTINNSNTYGNTSLDLTGKLTLRKVQHFVYDDNGGEHTLPSTTFKYAFDKYASTGETPDPVLYAKYNPSYKAEGNTDAWGGYVEANTGIFSGLVRNSSYTEISKPHADANAKVYNLVKVAMPSGGYLDVDYEANDYSNVQDKKPFAMRKIIEAVPGLVAGTTKLTVDITDLIGENKNLADISKTGDSLFSEVCFYRTNSDKNPPNASRVYVVSGKSTVINYGSTKLVGDRWYQDVTLSDNSEKNLPILITAARNYMLNTSEEMKSFKENFGNCNTASAEATSAINLSKDGGFDALRKFITNTVNVFIPPSVYETGFRACFGEIGSSSATFSSDPNISKNIVSQMSYLRTNIYKAKYTGSRVKKVTLRDNFNYATSSDGNSSITKDNSYSTVYVYNNTNGQSYGVATVEPGGGPSNVIDAFQKTGTGFMPSPAIFYSKVRVKNDYEATAGTNISRDKGYTEYEYFTSLDPELQFDNYFKQSIAKDGPGVVNGSFSMFGIFQWVRICKKCWFKWVRIPVIFPILLRWNRYDNYSQKSYAYTDYSDLLTRPKSIRTYSSNSTVPLSEQTFEYFKPDDKLTVLKPNLVSGSTNLDAATSLNMRPGLVEQHWAEAYRTEKMNSYAFIVLNITKTTRNFVMTDVRYKSIPPVIKSISTTQDGMKSVANFTKFDYFTGQPLETQYVDPTGLVKTSQVVPAYWVKPEMGPLTSNSMSNMNNLTASAKEIQFLGSTYSSTSMLSSSVTEWKKSGYGFVDNIILQTKTLTSNGLGIDKTYKIITAAELQTAYTSGTNSNKVYVQQSNDKFYKPTVQWVYKTDLNTNGTYNGYVDYDFTNTTQNAKWQKASETTRYDANGNAIESKDILGKYISSKIGHLFSYGSSQTANASYYASLFEGGEASYTTLDLNLDKSILLDATNVSLGNALINDGTAEYTDATLNASTLVGTPISMASWCLPSNITRNSTFAQINVTFNGTINRVLNLSIDENNKLNVVTNRGEIFKGFYVRNTTGSGCLNQQFIVDPSKIILNAITNLSGLSINSTISTQTLANCSDGSNISYKIPINEGFKNGIHTGQRAFILPSNTTGTIATINKNQFGSEVDDPVNGFKRSYKAMVWVHKSSAAETYLVATLDDKPGELKIKLNAPFAVAGDWSLLRLDIPVSEFTANTTKLVISVQNRSTVQGSSSYYDDLRVLPTNAAMSASVYNPLNGRLTSTLDDNNFATWFVYDDRGRLIKSTVEIENIGRKVVKKQLYNDQKND